MNAQTRIEVEHLPGEAASRQFRFAQVPPPARNDAAANGRWEIVSGRADPNSGGLSCLNDGRLPSDEDVPAANFFFAQGTDGGRVYLDLTRAVRMKALHTYSWHPDWRGPQVYDVYVSDGASAGFQARPARGTDPTQAGWHRLARVDTRPRQGQPGGQYAVRIAAVQGDLGTYRHVLFDFFRTEDRDAFGNTFFSEVDVWDADAPPPEPCPVPTGGLREIVIAGGRYRAVVDTSASPEFQEWVEEKVAPMIQTWYPRLVEMLPSQGFEAPARFTVVFDPAMQGVAATSGTRIRCASGWFRQNLKGEALGALFHEMVHVVQQYGRAPRQPGATRAPGWLTEGITDYLRFFIFEPETKGAEITARNLPRARYDGSYRITANFLNWVSGRHGKDFVPKLNAFIREGRYNEQTWKELTGHSVEELGDMWRKDLEMRLGVGAGG
ncbi:basic secretory protein-like protein [Fontisphaera persica]|uniref:basic secretory protein-like protein n=1 Tax=Fontisphaera persica TaxID=2974023 RepID=UPI0024BFDF2C|nr:basic secretory protein-like protein [Fontisphaera persica]WCJ60664.1 basic secretory protein-like protein [Fontisphaera persica]